MKTHFQKCIGSIIYCSDLKSTNELSNYLTNYLEEIKTDKILNSYDDVQSLFKKLKKQEIKVLLMNLSAMKTYYTNFILPTNVNLVIFENMPS